MRATPTTVILLLALSACGVEPAKPTFVAAPRADILASLRAAEVSDPDLAAERLHGQMGALFGSLEHPGYYLRDEWIDEDRDPSMAWWELSDPAVDAVRAGNRVRFAAQLGALASLVPGADPRPVELPKPLRADVVWQGWQRNYGPLVRGEVALAGLHPDAPGPDEASEDDPSFTWADEAQRHFESHYPSLTESAELYRVRCLMCHGATGGGDGPTGRYLDPPPRDFRDGIFKWVGVEWNARPRRADLVHVLEQGVRGTAMPSFRGLSRGEVEGLVDWVRYLAVRGETESLAAYFAAQEGAVRIDKALDAYGTVWARWDAAAERAAFVASSVPRAASAESIARGAELFRGTLANCASCHGTDGEGDGEAIWETAEDGSRSRRADQWGHPSRPRNLTFGVFRGGDRPADLYRRIKYGIGGTIMPAAEASLTDDDIWSLVHFVLSLKGGAGGEDA